MSARPRSRSNSCNLVNMKATVPCAAIVAVVLLSSVIKAYSIELTMDGLAHNADLNPVQSSGITTGDDRRRRIIGIIVICRSHILSYCNSINCQRKHASGKLLCKRIAWKACRPMACLWKQQTKYQCAKKMICVVERSPSPTSTPSSRASPRITPQQECSFRPFQTCKERCEGGHQLMSKFRCPDFKKCCRAPSCNSQANQTCRQQCGIDLTTDNFFCPGSMKCCINSSPTSSIAPNRSPTPSPKPVPNCASRPLQSCLENCGSDRPFVPGFKCPGNRACCRAVGCTSDSNRICQQRDCGPALEIPFFYCSNGEKCCARPSLSPMATMSSSPTPSRTLLPDCYSHPAQSCEQNCDQGHLEQAGFICEGIKKCCRAVSCTSDANQVCQVQPCAAGLSTNNFYCPNNRKCCVRPSPTPSKTVSSSPVPSRTPAPDCTSRPLQSCLQNCDPDRPVVPGFKCPGNRNCCRAPICTSDINRICQQQACGPSVDRPTFYCSNGENCCARPSPSATRTASPSPIPSRTPLTNCSSLPYQSCKQNCEQGRPVQSGFKCEGTMKCCRAVSCTSAANQNCQHQQCVYGHKVKDQYCPSSLNCCVRPPPTPRASSTPSNSHLPACNSNSNQLCMPDCGSGHISVNNFYCSGTQKCCHALDCESQQGQMCKQNCGSNSSVNNFCSGGRICCLVPSPTPSRTPRPDCTSRPLQSCEDTCDSGRLQMSTFRCSGRKKCCRAPNCASKEGQVCQHHSCGAGRNVENYFCHGDNKCCLRHFPVPSSTATSSRTPEPSCNSNPSHSCSSHCNEGSIEVKNFYCPNSKKCCRAPNCTVKQGQQCRTHCGSTINVVYDYFCPSGQKCCKLPDCSLERGQSCSMWCNTNEGFSLNSNFSCHSPTKCCRHPPCTASLENACHNNCPDGTFYTYGFCHGNQMCCKTPYTNSDNSVHYELSGVSEPKGYYFSDPLHSHIKLL